MKKLKIKLLYSLLIIITIFNLLNVIYNQKINFKYDLNTKEITGIITNYQIKENKLKIEIKNKNKILCNYYINDKNEMKYLNNIIRFGLKIKLTGQFKEIDQNRNFNTFNYKKYLYSKKIYYIFDIEKIDIIKEENLIYKIKNKIKKRCDKLNKYVNLFVFGYNNLDDQINDSFRQNGISHLFSISGMHITLFTSLLIKLLKKINYKISSILIILFLIFYMFLTNYTVSVMRASLLFIFLFIKKILKLKISTLNIMVILICLFLLYNPYYIYNIGFIFSFSISLSLILFSKIINNFKNYFIKTFIISYLSFLVSIPILINNFNEINLLSPFINVIFVPLISIIIFPFSLLTFVFSFLNPILNILTNVFEYISLFLNKISFFVITLSSINFIFIILYYILIFIMIKNIHKKRYILILLLIFLFHQNINYFNKEAIITMIDVGQGDSILMQLSNNKGNILIDTGGKYNYGNMNNYSNISNYTIIPYLKSVGIDELDYLILTHGDYDHMGEAINLVNNFKVEKVIFNCGEYNDLEQELINVLYKKKIPYYSCIRELNIDDNKLYFLNDKDYGNENDNSTVIYTELNNHKFVFMGDAGVEVEDDLIEKYNLQEVDVLKVGHHGSKTSSGKEFVAEVNPKYSIISVGKNNRYGHPNKEVLDNLKDSKIYRTDQDGSVMFKINNNKLKIETCSP